MPGRVISGPFGARFCLADMSVYICINLSTCLLLLIHYSFTWGGSDAYKHESFVESDYADLGLQTPTPQAGKVQGHPIPCTRFCPATHGKFTLYHIQLMGLISSFHGGYFPIRWERALSDIGHAQKKDYICRIESCYNKKRRYFNVIKV